MEQVQEKDFAANSKTTVKSKTKQKRGRPWPKGTSGNPKGAPKRGQSWTEVMRWWSDQTPAQIVKIVGTDNALGLGFVLQNMPQRVVMKNLVTLRLLQALMFDPSSGLLKEYLDRVEGKVPDNINMGVQENMRPFFESMDKIYGPYFKKHPNEIPKPRKSKRSKPAAGA